MDPSIDPLAETQYEVLPGLIHKYPNRILFLVTYECPVGCAFCFRKNLNQNRKQRATIPEVVSYIEKHPEINEVIFSGGEPLLESGEELIQLVNSLIRNPLTHRIKLFRIHTRLPIILPGRVQPLRLYELAQQTEKPIYIVLHTNHPSELANPQTRTLINKLRKSGFILLSHTVFLKGINDSVSVLQDLFNGLIQLGIKPYYLFHCDSMAHTKRFVVPIKTEIAIMKELHKNLSGIAVPTHVIDSSTGKGKIPLPSGFWDCALHEYEDFQGNKIKNKD